MFALELAVLALLFAASAFFAASEAALTTLSTLKVKQLAAERPVLSRPLGEWLAKPHRLFTTILVGNNAVNIAISSLCATIAAPLAARLPEQVVEVMVWLGATAVLLVFGEIVPKIVARTYAERISLWALPVLTWLGRSFAFVFRPFNWLLDRVAGGHAAPVNRVTAVSLEEMHHILTESQAAGQMSRESGEMMGRVLSVSQRAAGDILHPAGQADAVALEVLDDAPSRATRRAPGETAELFVDLLVETGRTRVPVTRAGVPVGYVHVMDLLKERQAGKGPAALIRPAPWVLRTMSVLDLLELFRRSGDHLAFVEDEAGLWLGLVTLEDVLEEIVGEILDEYDLEKKKA